MHTSLIAWVVLCVQTGPACSPNSIDNFIFFIQLNLAEIWACACKQIGSMHISLRAWGEVCTQKDQTCPPASIDTLISLILT